MINTDDLFSDLYLACEIDDIDQVKKVCLQSNTDFTSINRIELNENTALHLASSAGHKEIVRFLLTNIGLIRRRLNPKGLTADQVPKDDEVRQLFHRPFAEQLERYSQYRKASYLLNEYFGHKKIDPLIRLYTMSTPFFSKTQEEGNPLEFTITCHFKSLQPRYFQGVVYRSVVTTRQCFH